MNVGIGHALDLLLVLVIAVVGGYAGGFAAVRNIVANLKASDHEQQEEILRQAGRRDEQGPPRR